MDDETKCKHGYPVGGWMDNFGVHQRCDACWQDKLSAKEAERVAKLTPAEREREIAEAWIWGVRMYTAVDNDLRSQPLTREQAIMEIRRHGSDSVARRALKAAGLLAD